MKISKEERNRRLRLVGERIARNPHRYNQMNWCGTHYCIAGHAVSLFDTLNVKRLVGRGLAFACDVVPATAEKCLGLSQEEADHLFYAGYLEMCSFTLKPGQRAKNAQAFIEHFIKYGRRNVKIQWPYPVK